MFDVNFQVQKNSTTQQLPYDFESIMHFRHNAFSKDLRQSTIIAVNSSISPNQLGASKLGTSLDFLHLNILYCGGGLLLVDLTLHYMNTLHPNFKTLSGLKAC